MLRTTTRAPVDTQSAPNPERAFKPAEPKFNVNAEYCTISDEILPDFYREIADLWVAALWIPGREMTDDLLHGARLPLDRKIRDEGTKMGSEQEFDKRPISSGFSESDELGLGGRHALSLEEQVA
jgi:hypothetical protein